VGDVAAPAPAAPAAAAGERSARPGHPVWLHGWLPIDERWSSAFA
jgi:hypothetical protein